MKHDHPPLISIGDRTIINRVEPDSNQLESIKSSQQQQSVGNNNEDDDDNNNDNHKQEGRFGPENINNNNNNFNEYKKCPNKQARNKSDTCVINIKRQQQQQLVNNRHNYKHEELISERQLFNGCAKGRPIMNYGATNGVKKRNSLDCGPLPPPPLSLDGSGTPNRNSDGDGHQVNTTISDIIGSFGLFQFMILLFSGLREALVGYDALIMSVILQPESEFLCADNLLASDQLQLVGQHNTTTTIAGLNELMLKQQQQQHGVAAAIAYNETAQCYRSLDGVTPMLNELMEPIRCQSWLFADETAEKGPSLVAKWSLVCHNHWLVAFIESAYFFGLVTGNLVWGYYADKFGRRPTYLIAHTIGLVFGSLAVVMPSIWLFALCRYLSAFGTVGYNIIYSIQVELIGAKHRSFCTILNHAGWGLGVIFVPIVDHLFDDYRPIIAMAPLLTLLMLPWAFWLPESSRWLMANGNYEQARNELLRAAKFNGRPMSPELEKKIESLEHRVKLDKWNQKEINTGEKDKKSYHLIFTNRKLLRDTCLLAYITCISHLYYYVLTINFAYMKNLSTEANFIISGAGDWVSVIVGALLLKLTSRKSCMSLFLFLMAGSFAFQSLIDSGLAPGLDTPGVITTNNGVGTLSALLLIFIVLIVNQEVYPTVVRQTGTSIINTLGECGSTIAPLLIQFSRFIGPWRANVLYTFVCLLGMVAAQFVTKTDDIELPDT